MKTKYIRVVVIMAILSVSGIMMMQIIWFKTAFDLKQRQFNQTVFLALQNVAEEILKYNQIQEPLSGLVNQLSSNYYAVNINSKIETSVLEFLLITEFKKRNISTNFEYGVYNCESEKMVYGGYIAMNDKPGRTRGKTTLPLWQNDNYYFSVLFPDVTMYITKQLNIWLVFNSISLVVCIFFGYALIILLKQKRLSEIQKDFINNMTHELKTPISTILVSTKLMEKPQINEQPELVLNYNRIITHETTRLKSQVDKVLQIALLDKDKIDFNFAPVDLHECIADLKESLLLLLTEKGGTLDLKPEASNPVINADLVHIANVFHNLTDNAIKYCEKSPHITISTQNKGKLLMVTIRDNGIGIKPEFIKKIFDKFYRIPTGDIHNVKGFGLGLYYVKTVMEKHRGKVSIQSEAGQGTEICLYFPLAKKQEHE